MPSVPVLPLIELSHFPRCVSTQRKTMSALVVDIGGTHITCAVSDENAVLFHVQKKTLPDFVPGRSSGSVWKEVLDTIAGYEGSFGKTIPREAPLIISFPGPVAYPSRILNAPTLVGSDTALPDLRSEIANLTGRRTYLINDISAAAWYLSRIVKDSRFLTITVSSGIGSKIFDRRHPDGVLDNVPYAGEIGHIKIDPSSDAMLCDCGGKGHLGAIASGRGIERCARMLAKQEHARFERSACVTQFHGSADMLTNEEHLVPAARLQDAWALEIIRRGTRPLAAALLAVTASAGLDRIVVIGGFALSLGQGYLDLLQEEMLNVCDYEILAEKIPGLLVMGNADEDACLQGAAVYALNIRSCSYE
jgi:predicted NBD/HSP70 family sugar kinase